MAIFSLILNLILVFAKVAHFDEFLMIYFYYLLGHFCPLVILMGSPTNGKLPYLEGRRLGRIFPWVFLFGVLCWGYKCLETPLPRNPPPPHLTAQPHYGSIILEEFASQKALQYHSFSSRNLRPDPSRPLFSSMNLRPEPSKALFSARNLRPEPSSPQFPNQPPVHQASSPPAISVFTEPHGASTVWGIMSQFVHGFWIWN